ncbi:undecaprenyl-diphosphate phosphatase [Helicobacter turcicus]|uniref:Undecaprenyl-diphosphatase n=1 Tax=Helicobacter turcicus TaxID=2867412 RepID=A0ABS7JLR9_9HELI|nr:undecaprenyl-diphosphate phosphatase [Helicobacter turcicus]MBX7490340.1 undecaprenyl-diphosphate phosphatase [Helicobacter turcicus]MBX7545081.1 undecaprenyl-diphosphate phosphatase [Helicobacter turcicus]
MEFLYAIILGIVEGLTEFLPISSTGHLILTSKLLGIPQDAFHKTFEVVIQLGSILAVIFIFSEKLFKKSLHLWIKLGIGFLPAGTLGFLFYPYIKALFAPITVSIMLILGGIVFIVLEMYYKEKEYHTTDVNAISYKQALFIGLFQALAMIPGTSRSGATIIGGLLLGCNRKVATEFSFLLALPTMIVASTYSLYENHEVLNLENILILGVGFIVAFFSALLAIKLFLNFVSYFNFIPFGIYRILLGIVFLFYLDII